MTARAQAGEAAGPDARRTALVVSPFATTPRDAGHRRRTHQMTRLLADAGYHVTFLLFAFEDHWAWSHDEDAARALRAEWDDTVIVHAGEHVGRPPVDGATHGLDEWWDASLQATVANVAGRRFFDVVVVHNVWLSKCFDFVHPASTKVLETHDLFHKRADAFARIGAAPSFFRIDREAELFGLSRADIVVTIQEHEARALLELSPRRIVNVPFYDAALEAGVAPARLRDPRKVSFGFLGSANPFNAHGMNALLAALEERVAATFAPVEVVVGGGVCAALRTRLPIKRLGRVETERAFYDGVDFAIAPVFDGTGFKIKTADALALACPLLAARHAAEGAGLDRALVCDTPHAMAARMAEISLRRPDPRPMQAKALRARDALRARTQAGEANLLRAVARAGTVLVVNLHDAEIGRSALKLQGWLGVARVLAGRARVLLLLPEPIRALVARWLPPGVRTLDAARFEVRADDWPSRVTVDATDAPGGRRCDIRDRRWIGGGLDPARPDWQTSAGGLDELPLLHSNAAWEPAAQRLREAWAATPEAHAAPLEADVFVLRVGGAAVRAGQVAIVDAGDDAAVRGVFMRMLCGAPARALVVSGAVPPHVRRLALEVCAITSAAFHGRVDDAAMARGRLPARLGPETGRRAEIAAAALVNPGSVACRMA